MTAIITRGPRTRSMTRGDEGHRDYEVSHLVTTNDSDDGPTVVMDTPGLPAIGAIWAFGNDLDVWAMCHPNMTVKPHETKTENTLVWQVKQKFSTRPLTRCQDESIEDPLLEPQKISGSFLRYTEEAVVDRVGTPIQSSSFEQVRGPLVERDRHRPTVIIEQNVAALGLFNFASIIDNVNDAPLWGMPRRTVKFQAPSFSRKLFGICDFYFTRRFEFAIKEDTFDRDDIQDQGTKVLRGHWTDADPPVWVQDIVAGTPAALDPNNFIRFKDPNGENIRVKLNGVGGPALDGTFATIPLVGNALEIYPETNLLVLGIPTDLEST